ncbi:MAG TPA: mycofactocin biosynthesis glycosyltransferase MftF [Acidimicrobiales bacterium]|nr:mycofactocin biosynthesis glycosyltransferase MftF [Acidimicrobiales bacterium]
MPEPRRTAPSLPDTPVDAGTPVVLDSEARFLDRNLVTGGSPWRLLRLAGGSRAVAERWQQGGVVGPGEGRFARTLITQGLLHPRPTGALEPDKVDVIIPVHEDAAPLRALLAQLRGLHVVVVDDASRGHELIEECCEEFGAALVRLAHNVGPGGARNAGLAATSRPLVWFIDADVSVDNASYVLERLTAQLEDPLVGAVAARIRGGVGDSARDRFERRFSPLDMGARSALVVPRAPVSYVPAACLVARRSALGDGFDPTLRVGEDVDLVWRLHDEGWLVRYVADVIVTHRARGTWRDWWHQRTSYGASAGVLAARHGDRLAPLRADVWTLVTWVSLAARRPAIALRVISVTRDALVTRLGPDTDRAGAVASSLVVRTMGSSIGPSARAVVRTYGPLLAVAALHPRLRRRALALYALGTAWRWRHEPLRTRDVPLALADDVAYCVGVWRGAWRARSARAITPQFVKPTIRLAHLVGARSLDDL